MNKLNQVRQSISRLHGDQKGASSVEYLIVMGLIAFCVYAGFQKFGKSVDTKVQSASVSVDGMDFDVK